MTPRPYVPDCALDPGTVTLALPCPWCGWPAGAILEGIDPALIEYQW
jgi:hypothetical protein